MLAVLFELIKPKKLSPAENYFVEIGGIRLEVRRKKVKSLRLVVFASGAVRVTAPLVVQRAALHDFVLTRLDWIRQQQTRFAMQPQPPTHKMISGENHYFQGRRLCLQVIEQQVCLARVEISGDVNLNLFVPVSSSLAQREAVLHTHYREHLKREIPLLIAKWQPRMNVEVAAWGVKKMKTRWGSCNIRARRIWLNLELAKHSPACLEYVVVHEMVHLLERGHNARFRQLMDNFLPQWRLLKAELNCALPGHADTEC